MKTSFETFRKIGDWEKSSWTAPEPYCFNSTVSIRKYRVTIDEIAEPVEVLKARLLKLWRECDNHHHWQPLMAVAKQLGFELTHDECGKNRNKK